MSIAYASHAEIVISGQESLQPTAFYPVIIIGPYTGVLKEVVQKWIEDAYPQVFHARQIAP